MPPPETPAPPDTPEPPENPDAPDAPDAPDNVDCILVTPVYKDSARLASFGPSLAKALAQSDMAIRWVIADDGSGEAERSQLDLQAASYRHTLGNVEVFGLDQHRGKGAAVREAWAHHANDSIEWLVFVDADGSTSASTILRLIRQAQTLGAGHAVLGARLNTPDTRVVRRPLRLLAGGIFSRLARLALGLRVRDVQCGVKVIARQDFSAIRPQLQEDGLAFDAELLHALQRLGVRLVPHAIDWVEKPGGSVWPLRSAWPMVKAVWRVRQRTRLGHYTLSGADAAG